uniref:Coiled-coil domain-containing protein 28b n=1 Tax=Culex tarsalis TaxID=7177 RepID=A0A1Q3F6F9_CULTA
MECDDAAVERQKLVSNDEEDDQTITNLSSSGPAKSQTPISPVLSSKIFSSGETSRSGHTASLGKPSEGAPSAKLNYINERRNQQQKAKTKKVPQRDLTPSSAVSSGGGGGGDGGSGSLPSASHSRHRGASLLRASAEHSLANSSGGGSGNRQHSTAATANSSSISLNKSHSFTSRPLKHHSFISEVPDVRHMERALLGLLDDFHSGKLKAFGSGCTMEQMTSIREQQESLAKLHFDLGNEPSFFASNADHNETQSQTNMQKLVAKLEQLSFSIEKLHSSNVEQ